MKTNIGQRERSRAQFLQSSRDPRHQVHKIPILTISVGRDPETPRRSGSTISHMYTFKVILKRYVEKVFAENYIIYILEQIPHKILMLFLLAHDLVRIKKCVVFSLTLSPHFLHMIPASKSGTSEACPMTIHPME
jgi:membrane-bound acyltransferase YfiQ involved in biofilm formation